MSESIRTLMNIVLNEADPGISGDVQGIMKAGPVNYDQKNGLGSVSDGANIKYLGFACFMYPRMFFNLAAHRDFGESSSLDALIEKISEGTAIGSPFLSVNLYDDVPKVINHEGRTRMKAIETLYPNVPVLVHVFPTGGERARHLSLEVLEKFRMEAIPEKQKISIRGPNMSRNVWWLDGWKTL